MSEPTSVSVRFVHQLRDHIDADRLLYRQSFFAKGDKIVAVLLLGFGVFCVAVSGLHWWTVIWFPLAIHEWFNLLSPRRLMTRIWFKRNPMFMEEYHLTFSSDNIHFKTVSIDSTLQWTHYNRVIEGSRLFLLLYGKGLYSVIPKRAFLTEAELIAFRALLKEKIPRYSVVSD